MRLLCVIMLSPHLRILYIVPPDFIGNYDFYEKINKLLCSSSKEISQLG